MIRRNEKRKNVKKHNWIQEKEPHYGYSETSMRGNRHGNRYGLSSPVMERTPRRHHSEYSYNTFEDRYNDWHDKYRRDQYSMYDSLYDTDDDETSRYQARRKYDDDYYDYTEFSSYYDEDDTDYTDKKSYSESRTYNKHNERRRGKMSDDSKYVYSYAENHPGFRHNHSYNKINKNYIPRENNEPRHRNNMDIYAIHNILGQKGLRYKKYNTNEPQDTSEIFSETDKESDYRGQAKRKMKPEYNIYSTQTTNNATAFDKKIKTPSPERLISVTDYHEIPVLAFKEKYKKGSPINTTSNGESDFVYLPVIMKEKDKKLANRRNVKTFPRFKNSTETAEKPLEDKIQVYRAMDSGQNNFLKYKNNKRSEQNPNIYNSNKKGINVYTVSSGPSQVFRKSATNPKNMKNIKSNTSVKSDNLTNQIPDTESSIVYITNRGASNEMINIEPTDSGGSIAVPLKTRSMEETRTSMAEPETKKESTKRSVSKLSTGAIRDKSVARKSSAIGKTSPVNNETFDTDMEGQNIHNSVIRQSYVPPREQSVLNERKSLATGQQRFASGLQSKLNNTNTPLKGIIKPSIAPQNRSVIKKSDVVDQQDPVNNSQYLGTNFSDLETEGQDLQKNQSRQSIAAPKSVARQSNVLPRSQNSMEKKKSLTTQQLVPKSLLRQSPKKSLVRQSSVIQRGQSFVDKDQVKGVEGQSTQKSMTRQSGVLQRGQSVEATGQTMETENQSTKKSFLSQSKVVRKGQSFVDRGQTDETELQSTQKSLAKQSSAAQNSQAFADRDQTLGIEEQSTQKSMGRQSSAPKRGQSYVDRDQVMETQRQSLVRQSNAAQRVQSFVNGDQVTGIENQNTKKSMARESSKPEINQSFLDIDQIMETQNTKKSLARQSSAAKKGQSFVSKDNTGTLGKEVQSTQKSAARQSSAVQRGQSVVDRDKTLDTEGQRIQKSVARQSSAVQRGQSVVDRDKTLDTEGQSIQKSVARQSSAVQRGQSVVDRDKTLDSEGQRIQKSVARQSSAVQRGQSVVDRDKTLDTEGQSIQKSLARQSSAVQRGQSVVDRDKTLDTEGQSIKKSVARQSSAVKRRGESFLDSKQVIGLEEQSALKNMSRQSKVAGRDQSFVVGDQITGIEGRETQKSMGGKSLTTQRGEDFVISGQETDGQSTQNSMAKQNRVTQRGQNFEVGRKSSFVEQQMYDSNLQDTDTLQPQISVLGPGVVSKRDQQRNSAVRQKTITRNEQGNIEDLPQSNIKSGITGSNLKQPQQSVGMKRPSKSKSKILMKRAFTKLGSFSRRHGQTEKDQDSGSTAPMLDIIMSEGNMPVESQNRQSSPQQPVSNVNEPMTEASSGSIKQQAISTKPKKSTKSKLSRPFKSLLWRPKKSDLRQKQPSNIENVDPLEQSDAETIQTKYIEQNLHSSEQSSEQYAEFGQPPTSDEAYDQTDADNVSCEELKRKNRTSSKKSADYPQDNFPLILKEYDLTPVLYFLQTAQYIVGVTMYDKLIEVFAVL